jgi:guanyl-specific ribonuclease Sa
MLLAAGPNIEDDFYSGALPPMPEIESIFMPQDERRSPEEKREEVEEIDEIFEEFDDLEREFLEDDREEFFEEGEFRLIEDDMPPPMHHEEEFRPMAEPIMRDEPMVEEREIEAEVERVEEEPEERNTSVSSANVSIALQASDAAVRQAVEVGAGLSSAEVIAIDAGQVDTSVAVQQDDGQQSDTPIHFEPTHEETVHIVQDTTQENYIEEAQQTEETQEDFSFDTSSEAVIDEQFGEQMTQSFATGGNIGTFLSGQSPNFQQFDVKPPEYDVQRDIDQVESAVSSMSSQDISQQAERLAEQIQEGGGFEDDQTIAVTVIGYVPGFESYRQDVATNQREFYRPETVYDGQKNIDDNRTMLFMTQQGDQRHTEMVADQYRR